METTSTVTGINLESLETYYRAIRHAYAMGGLEAVMRDYGMVLAVALLAVLVLVLLLVVLLLPRRRKIVHKRVVRVTRHAMPSGAAPSVEPEAVGEGESEPAAESGRTTAGLLKRWSIPIVCGVIVIAGFVAAYVVTGSNGYCGQSCHFEDPVVMTALENRHADCIDCHESGPVSGGVSRLRMAYAYSRSETSVVDASVPVSPTRCLRCHRDVARDTVETATGVRISHKEVLASGRTCSDCHENVGHRERRSAEGGMAQCTVCHDGKTASAECSLCHPGGTPLVAKRTMDDAGSAYSYPTVQVANRDCSRCHGTNNKKCLNCHNGFLLPHPEEFREGGHAPIAAFDGRERCYKCHSIYWCGDGKCHQSFTPHDAGTWPVEHRKGTSETCGSCHIAWDGTGNWCDVCH